MLWPTRICYSIISRKANNFVLENLRCPFIPVQIFKIKKKLIERSISFCKRPTSKENKNLDELVLKLSSSQLLPTSGVK